MSSSLHFAAQREMMVDCQIRTVDVTDPALLSAMYDVPRERFVAPEYVALAYADGSLPSAGGKRQLLAPMVIARMIQAARLRGNERVLDIAVGSGYSAALMSRLAASVVAVESDAGLTEAARAALGELGVTNVLCVTGPLEKGCPADAPYDVILVNGAVEEAPTGLLGQLVERGRLIAIDASAGAPKAVLFERIGNETTRRLLFDAAAPVLDGFRKAPGFVF